MGKILGIIFGVVALVLVGVSFSGMTTVEEGNRGVKLVFGTAQEQVLDTGLYFYNPFTTDVVQMSVRSEVTNDSIQVQTEDNQQVTVNYIITYYLKSDSVVDMYSVGGRNWVQKFIPQAADGSVKEVVGNQTASSIVTAQKMARVAILNRLKDTLEPRGIVVENFEFGKIDYDAAWLQSVGEKQRAEELAKKAVNDTRRIEEEAKQVVIAAEAEAESLRIMGEALAENKDLVALKAVEQWDGKLPVYSLGDSIPFIGVPSK